MTPGCSYSPTEVICSPTTAARTVVMSGVGGDDLISVDPYVSQSVNTVVLGNSGNDDLDGGMATEDFMVDGPGTDSINGSGADDGLVNTSGTDFLNGDAGNDLILSSQVCSGDNLNGGTGVDSASWAKYENGPPKGSVPGVYANILTGIVGRNSSGQHAGLLRFGSHRSTRRRLRRPGRIKPRGHPPRRRWREPDRWA